MIRPRFTPLIYRNVVRHRVRTFLTVAGVALAMFLFCAVQAMRTGLTEATRQTSEDVTLIVYRENRYCPFTSQLPEDYSRRIQAISGVASVVPTQITVSNCRASLDMITYRGVPAEAMTAGQVPIRIIEGSMDDWLRRTDAALVGERLASRRGIRIGDRFSAAGITVHVAGIVSSENPQDQAVAYVHLPFLQRAAGNRQGIVTQFSVRVSDPSQLETVAAAIDEEFRHSQAPTWTSSEKEFVARAVSDIIDLVHFAGWLGIGSLIAVFALIANSISLSVQDRVRDHAVMQTLGFPSGLIARLVMVESMTLSLAGGVIGVTAASIVSRFGQFTLSMEGMSVFFRTGPSTILIGFVLCIVIGVGAGMLPALRASHLSTAEAFRAV